ncbi:MAG: copper chaperone [Alphaproteobacteria bacterium]|nr:MAG: copper chaperone [Alphaproteobacteria bacterium]
MKFSIPDMSCGHCKAAIEKAVTSVDPSAQVKVDLEAHTAEVVSSTGAEALMAALKAAGYEAQLAE